MTNLQFKPDLSPGKIEENLSRIVVPGEIRNGEMESRITRLRERFRVYAATCHHGLWAPGLVITGETRSVTDCYLPMAELARVFHRFLSLALRYFPPVTASPIHAATTWPDALHQLQPYITSSDPAVLLERLMADESFRIGFLFALFVPKRHGGGFKRYPGQWEFLRKWLKERNPGRKDKLRCLDTACATGESTYELAMLLTENSLPPESFLVHGSTLEPLELFAAAHIFFPHHPGRQDSFRRRTEPVFVSGAFERMVFFTEDITRPCGECGEGYDVIICNGLLGGPQLSCGKDLETVVKGLEARLRDGGIILAADHFHGGWKKRSPAPVLHGIFSKYGLRVHHIGEGIVAERV